MLRSAIVLSLTISLSAFAADDRAVRQAAAGKKSDAHAAGVPQTGNKVQTELYTVVDGAQVDAKTMEGFRTWRAAACDRCHGANQEGLVGPSLLASLKALNKDQFRLAVLEGRLEKGMPSFKASESVSKNIDHLYAYLKGRSDGAIVKAKVQELK